MVTDGTPVVWWEVHTLQTSIPCTVTIKGSEWERYILLWMSNMVQDLSVLTGFTVYLKLRNNSNIIRHQISIKVTYNEFWMEQFDLI